MGTIYVPWLADAARSTGYRVVEIAGWRTRGHTGLRLLEVVVGHHTATPATARGDYPSLGVVANGRTGLSGPLANLGLGRDGTIYVIAAGVGYHAGASRWAGYVDLNDESIGIEAESPGDGTWTLAQRDCYPKLVAALLRYMSRGVDRYAGHKDVCVPTGRKPDPAGIDSGQLRATAQQYLNHGIPLEDAMPTAAEVVDELFRRKVHFRRKDNADPRGYVDDEIEFGALLADVYPAFFWGHWNNWGPGLAPGLRDLASAVAGVRGDVTAVKSQVGGLTDDEAKVIAAVQGALAAVQSGGVEPEQFAAALAPVLAPMIQAGATPGQVQAAAMEGVRLAFARAGVSPEEGTPTA
jgi:hypothetical protein